MSILLNGMEWNNSDTDLKTFSTHSKRQVQFELEHELYCLVLYILLQNCLPPLLVKRLIGAGTTREREILTVD